MPSNPHIPRFKTPELYEKLAELHYSLGGIEWQWKTLHRPSEQIQPFETLTPPRTPLVILSAKDTYSGSSQIGNVAKTLDLAFQKILENLDDIAAARAPIIIAPNTPQQRTFKHRSINGELALTLTEGRIKSDAELTAECIKILTFGQAEIEAQQQSLYTANKSIAATIEDFRTNYPENRRQPQPQETDLDL